MSRVLSITIYDDSPIHDIQLWSTSPVKLPDFSRKFIRIPNQINHQVIPVYLMSSQPCTCYSSVESTNEYFETNLVRYSSNEDQNGILFQEEDWFLLFYYDKEIKLMILDLSHLSKIVLVVNQSDVDMFITVKDKETISIFDRVLNNKKKPRMLPQKETTVKETDISLVINKVILSGLRIRGLSLVNHSANDKLAIKEIYQMTLKSTLFALRKFKYGFNGISSNDNSHLTVIVIQEIVEKLLQVFVDSDSQGSILQTRGSKLSM